MEAQRTNCRRGQEGKKNDNMVHKRLLSNPEFNTLYTPLRLVLYRLGGDSVTTIGVLSRALEPGIATAIQNISSGRLVTTLTANRALPPFFFFFFFSFSFFF